MKRYYISPVTGDGSIENPYRPVIAEYHYNAVGELDMTKGWALVLVDTQDHSLLLADNRFFPLPDMDKDDSMSTLSASDKLDIRNKCTELGITLPITTENGELRELVRLLGRDLNDNFHEDRMDIGPVGVVSMETG